MNIRLITIIVILTISCETKTADWQTLDFGDFKIKAPNDWRKFKEQGIDAYIGGLTNGKDSLWFYFGSFVSGFQGDNENYLFAQDTINGKIAAIKLPKKDSAGSIEMFINNANNQTKFVLAGSSPNRDLVLKIFKSVVFQSSDTTKNGTLNTAKFKKYPLGSGTTIYNWNCTSCHSRNKTSVGPALTTELINSRTNEWLYTFFKDRRNLKQDSAYLARKGEFNDANCIELSDYSKEDVEQLISYIKGQ
jgi:hypothetical protein